MLDPHRLHWANMSPHAIEIAGSVCFAAAILHTFMAGKVRHAAHKYRPGSPRALILHALGEIELVFALWAVVFLVIHSVLGGLISAVTYFRSLHFGEPIFVFLIMTVMSAQPILNLATAAIESMVFKSPFKNKAAVHFFLCMTLGPLLGSLITEPAAMTVTALLMLNSFYRARLPANLKYLALGTLFVNVSVGGTLTHYAAPPVLMVAGVWGWDTPFMFSHFGWKSLLIITLANVSLMLVYRDTFRALAPPARHARALKLTPFVVGLLTLKGSKLREAALVGVFLAGLVILGGYQRWWLEPLMARMSEFTLFSATIGLTALVDNAALTYLAAQVEGLAEAAKYLVVAGAVAGGGLTVIANAPNPAGAAILTPAFGQDGIAPVRLLLGALWPTLIAALAFWFL